MKKSRLKAEVQRFSFSELAKIASRKNALEAPVLCSA
jgi:hypothetical protein